jgi:glycoprotein endo-alpha-1,2-mannosidase
MNMMNRKSLYIFSLVLGIGINSCKDESPASSDSVRITVTPRIEKVTVGSEHSFTCNIAYYNGDVSRITYNWTSTCVKKTAEFNTKTITWQAPAEADNCNIKVVVGDGKFSKDYSFDISVEPEKDMVGVYYYPWHGNNNFHGKKYLREFLVPAQLPVLGEYDDTKASVIEQHFEWSSYAGINLWVCSWWGPMVANTSRGREDNTIRNHILPNSKIKDLKIALFYESTSRLTNTSISDEKWNTTENVASDIQHMATHYWNHPNYYRIDGRPVLFIYLTRAMHTRGILVETVKIMREQASLLGHNIYIVGDHAFNRPTNAGQIEAMALLDAITNYDVYGSSGGRNVLYATQAGVDNYHKDMADWKNLANARGAKFIPAVSPGYNDAGVRPENLHQPLSRKLAPDDEYGSLFKAHLKGALKLTDPGIRNLFMINSWNEWHEDTQIEPVVIAPPTSTDVSGTGVYTWGLEYEGYGMKYLDILKEAIKK